MKPPKLTLVLPFKRDNRLPTAVSYFAQSFYNEDYDLYDTEVVLSFDKKLDKATADMIESALLIAADIVLQRCVEDGKLKYTDGEL